MRADFARAVAEHRLESFTLEAEPRTAAELRHAVARTDLLLLGEVHGAAETPRALYTLMDRLDLRGLALEWDETLRPFVNRYVESGQLALDDPPIDLLGGDGRITAGHLPLLRRLAAEGRLELLVLFNADGESFDERDLRMAERLLAGLRPGVPTLAVAGNAHTALVRGEWGLPMGAHVASVVTNVPVAELRYRGGAVHNITVKRLPGEPGEGDEARLATMNGRLVFELPRATPAIVPRPAE